LRQVDFVAIGVQYTRVSLPLTILWLGEDLDPFGAKVVHGCVYVFHVESDLHCHARTAAAQNQAREWLTSGMQLERARPNPIAGEVICLLLWSKSE
jgi:hypothetical protein